MATSSAICLPKRPAGTDPGDGAGIGIAVEADTAVTGNVIENAPTAGMMLGWGHHLRDVAATGNVVRTADIGIGVSVATGAGTALIANNMIADVATRRHRRHGPPAHRHRRSDARRRRALRQSDGQRQPPALTPGQQLVPTARIEPTSMPFQLRSVGRSEALERTSAVGSAHLDRSARSPPP